jgi:hypothetical protein
MATPHLCRSNPEIFCDGSSYINTALDELPNEISNFLNIPDTLVIMWIITVMIMVMMANLEIRSEIGSRSTLDFFSSLVFFIVGLNKHTDTFHAVTVRLTIQPPEAMTTLNTPN